MLCECQGGRASNEGRKLGRCYRGPLLWPFKMVSCTEWGDSSSTGFFFSCFPCTYSWVLSGVSWVIEKAQAERRGILSWRPWKGPLHLTVEISQAQHSLGQHIRTEKDKSPERGSRAHVMCCLPRCISSEFPLSQHLASWLASHHMHSLPYHRWIGQELSSLAFSFFLRFSQSA